MSGIAGIFTGGNEAVSEKELKRLTESLGTTSPDGSFLWTSPQIGLTHSFLRTRADQSASGQVYEDGALHLVCDARIDNRQWLTNKIRSEVGPEDHGSQPTTDAHLIINAYKAWGTDCTQHLIGDFVFAIWDSRLEQLFCARDQLGVKQLFYYYNGRDFVFSNLLSTLRLHPQVGDELNELAVADFFLFGLNQDPGVTIFAGVQRLPQAHCLIVSKSNLTIREYWRPSVGEIRYKSSNDYVERFRELLDQAVADRTNIERVSISMSGGLDSSAVAASVSQKRQSTSVPDTRAFCVVYEKAFRDEERTYATLAADHLGIPIEFLDAVSINETNSARSEGFAPEPFHVNPIYIVTDHLLAAMANHSRVGITGWDGDTFLDEPPRHLFKSLFKNRRMFQLAKKLAQYTALTHRVPPIGIRTKWREWRHPDWNDWPFPSFLNDSFTKKHQLLDRWRHFNRTPTNVHSVRPRPFRICQSPSWSALLASFDSGVTGLKLEVRHPLLDLRVVEYALSLPVVPWLIEKRILREALRGRLPEKLITRPKSPLVGDPGLQLRYSTKLRSIDAFQPVPGLLTYINRAAVPSVSDETDRNQLWMNLRPFSFNEWLRRVHSPNGDAE